MKRTVLPVLLGLLLGLGGGTGYVIFTGPAVEPEAATEEQTSEGHGEEVATADSTEVPDSVARPPVGSSGLINTAELASLSRPAADTATPVATADTASAPPAEAPGPAEPAPAASTPEVQAADVVEIPDPVPDDEAAKRLAKIFGTMQARDAARVLSLLKQDEIERILRQLDNRSAAKILASLDAELAAALSSTLIHGEA